MGKKRFGLLQRKIMVQSTPVLHFKFEDAAKSESQFAKCILANNSFSGVFLAQSGENKVAYASASEISLTDRWLNDSVDYGSMC
jgi:hypothetical protein